MTLPIPFTLASLAVGASLDTTHVVALNFLLAYTHGVRLLHDHARVPIIPAIIISAAGYCLAGAFLRPLLPLTPAAFWLACALTLLVAGATRALYRKPNGPGHRSHLPFWIKFPLVAGVILTLILMKRVLQGFMALFPMVLVVASYETRYNLGSVCAALPDFMFAMVPMMAVVRLVQPQTGLPAALGVGWIGFIFLQALLVRDFWGPRHQEVAG